MEFAEIRGIVGRGETLIMLCVNHFYLFPFKRQNEAPHGLYATGIISKTYRQVNKFVSPNCLNPIVNIKTNVSIMRQK